MLRVRIATDHLQVSADAFCRTVAALLGIGRGAVNPLQLAIVHVHSKRAPSTTSR